MKISYHKKAIKAVSEKCNENLDDYQINHIIEIAKRYNNMKYFEGLPEGDFIIAATEGYFEYMSNVYFRLEGMKCEREYEENEGL